MGSPEEVPFSPEVTAGTEKTRKMEELLRGIHAIEDREDLLNDIDLQRFKDGQITIEEYRANKKARVEDRLKNPEYARLVDEMKRLSD